MINVNNVSKTYLVWKTPFSRLFVPVLAALFGRIAPHWVNDLRDKYCYPVNALTNINLSVASGDSLGIIGLNGSGKSTLLQIIAGTLQPTAGSVELHGRVAALLELGSGFDPEFTGRENVYLNASILGLTRAEIDARYNEIVQFADIGDFINHPVKTYSSGMMVRLAFAVQVHVDPDVLIVDEALSVGDARFQAKALAKIEAILKSGTTLLFVGHDLSAVRAFCNRAMLLAKGQIVRVGIPDDVIADYLYVVQKDRIQEAGFDVQLNKKGNDLIADGFTLASAEFDGIGHHNTLAFNSEFVLNLEIQKTVDIEKPFLILDIVDSRGLQLTGKRIPLPDFIGVIRLKISTVASFQKGIYRIRVRLVSAPSLEQTVMLSRFDDLLSLEVIDDVRHLFTGIFPLEFHCVCETLSYSPELSRA